MKWNSFDEIRMFNILQWLTVTIGECRETGINTGGSTQGKGLREISRGDFSDASDTGSSTK